MVDKMSQLHRRQLPKGGLPTKATTHSSRLYREFGEGDEEGSEGYIATYIKDYSQDVLLITSMSSACSSKVSVISIMLAITNAIH